MNTETNVTEINVTETNVTETNVTKTNKEDLIKSSTVYLQCLWKRKFKLLTTHRIVKYLLSLGLTHEHVNSISFDSLVVFLRGKDLISASKACLQRIYYLCISRHGSSNTSFSFENDNIKVFLSVYMIACHPNSIFDNMGTVENELYKASIPLITTFQNICNVIHLSNNSFHDVSHDLTKDFLSLLFKYVECFKEWKLQDEIVFVGRIKNALSALYNAKKQLPHNEPDNSHIKIELLTQINQLRNKLEKIAGSEALVQFEQQYTEQYTEQQYTEQQYTEQQYTEQQYTEQQYTEQYTEEQSESNNSNELDNSEIIFPKRINNEYLAHELLINPKFQLDCSDNKEYLTFWNSLENDLKCTIPSYSKVLQILKKINDEINDLTKDLENINILEIININFIKQQIEANLYTWINFNQLILSIVEVIQKIQVPQRNNETKEQWELISKQIYDASVDEQPQVLCNSLKFIINCFNSIRIDLANERLRLIAPVIKDYGIEYEQNKFQNKLVNGTITLERTQNWIRLNLRHEVELNKVDLNLFRNRNTNAFIHFHSISILSLITNEITIKTELCPETILFDVHRLFIIQQEFQYIVTSITIMIKVKKYLSLLNNDELQVLTSITELFTQETKLKIDLEQTIIEINNFIEHLPLTQENKKNILKDLEHSTSFDDPIYQCVSQQIKLMCIKIMKDEIIPNNLFLGIDIVKIFIPRIEKSVKKLVLLTNINWKVHSLIYKKIIEDEAIKMR